MGIVKKRVDGVRGGMVRGIRDRCERLVYTEAPVESIHMREKSLEK